MCFVKTSKIKSWLVPIFQFIMVSWLCLNFIFKYTLKFDNYNRCLLSKDKTIQKKSTKLKIHYNLPCLWKYYYYHFVVQLSRTLYEHFILMVLGPSCFTNDIKLLYPRFVQLLWNHLYLICFIYINNFTSLTWIIDHFPVSSLSIFTKYLKIFKK